METKMALALFSLLLACIMSHGHRTKDFLFLKQKLKINTGIDKTLFNASRLFNDIGPKSVPDSKALQKEKDLIVNLPGQPPVPFNQYGGYVTVDQKAGRALFYYFVEADQRVAHKLPLLLWLNGGPGCSSLGYGAMEELGPFRVNSDGKTLFLNKYAWNNVANVLFLETPAGVGFSYSKTKADIESGNDKRTTTDNYVFLVNWLKTFPEYKDRDFYIAGESYAGHYVPQLADSIIYLNTKAKKNIINLKGIMIGNPEINDETDFIGAYEYLGSHALISDDVAHQILKYCDFSPHVKKQSHICQKAMDEADKVYGEIDIYNIYAPRCSHTNLVNKPQKNSVSNFDPCVDNYVKAYLNRPDVQKALHANVTKIPYNWDFCSDRLFNNWSDSPRTVIPILKDLISHGLRLLIYSGDIDGRVPVTSTQLSIKQMMLPIEISWQPWKIHGQVGGYTTVYKSNLTFATIRGAGHDVPRVQPARALLLVRNFLAGKELPKYHHQ